MKFSLLAAAALCGSTVNAEIYFKEQFNDDVSLNGDILYCGADECRSAQFNAKIDRPLDIERLYTILTLYYNIGSSWWLFIH